MQATFNAGLTRFYSTQNVYSYTYILILLSIILLGCTSAHDNGKNQTGTIAATELQPYGRYIINNEKQLELIGSAAHIGFEFEGKEAKVFASAPLTGNHGYLQYELDGKYQKRVKVSGFLNEPIVIEAPTEGKHTVWVYKATEATTGPLYLEKVSGKNIKAITKPDAPIIEFIGNSITCGAAADASEVACGEGEYHDQHNAYMAYGPRVARALDTNFVLSCVSGIGVYRNWNSNGPTMPQVYNNLNFKENSTHPWNNNTFKPEVVSIALGTNDFSQGDGKNERLPFDSARFVNSYVQFVQQVKAKYPQAKIALLSSPMLNGSSRTKLQNCLSAVKAETDRLFPGDKPIALHFFKPMQARGCGGHPSVEDHGTMASELVPFFRDMLKQK